MTQPVSTTVASAMDELGSALDRATKRVQRLDLPKMLNGMNKAREVSIALETANNSMLAVRSFASDGIGKSEGEKYLRLYGFLQAIYLQQDALKHLSLSLSGSKPKQLLESGWGQLRRLRNLMTGHPAAMTHNPEKLVHRSFIRRPSLESTGFSFVVWTEGCDQAAFIDVDFAPNLVDYFTEATRIVNQFLPILARGPEYRP